MSIFTLIPNKTVQYFSTQQEFPTIMDKRGKRGRKLPIRVITG